MKSKVLVTALGTMTASTIADELKKKDYYVVGADINKKYEIASSLFVDEFFTFPSVVEDAKKYLDYVLDFCCKENIEYYFPVIDEEVMSLSKRREDFISAGIKLCIPNMKTLNICHYKDVFYKWVNEFFPDVAIKTYSNLSDIKEFPVFVKPIEGRASIGCKVFNSVKELNQERVDAQKKIVQEVISGDQITVDLIRNSFTGESFQVSRRELIRNKNGCGIAVEIIYDEELKRICDSLMRAIDLNGVVNAEFFKTSEGYKLIEINPRFSAGTKFSCMVGCNTVLNSILIADKKNCIFPQKIPQGKHLAKRYETYMMD